jgi:AhpD family alkylhydroperoxidase
MVGRPDWLGSRDRQSRKAKATSRWEVNRAMSVNEMTGLQSRAIAALEQEIKVEPVLRELVKVRASIVNGCAYCIDLHSKRARKAGESEQRIYTLAAWRDAPSFSERERAALALTDAVTLVAEACVPAGIYEEAAQHFDSDELTHLIWQIATINAWHRVTIATHASDGALRL